MVDFWEMNNQAMEVDDEKSEKTSNRQAPLVVDNCMLRYLAKEKRNDRSENFKKQESMISKQACLLPDAVNTMEVDAEKLSSRQFNWFFNYMCYKESKLKALIIKTQNLFW
jgi:hypothetical protein